MGKSQLNKQIDKLIEEAHDKWHHWSMATEEQLEDASKSRGQAMVLANYFEGRYDGLMVARGLINGRKTKM